MKPLKIPSRRWSITYHPVQDIIFSFAIKYPVLVTGTLYSLCSEFDLDDLVSSPETLQWCGCHLRSEFYRSYADTFGVRPECSPTCTAHGVIKSINGQGEEKLCKQSICIVNNVKSVIDRSKAKDIKLSQICSHCSDKDSCRCVIDGADVNISKTDISGSANIVKELCSNVLCNISDPENPSSTVTVPCTGPSILYYRYRKKIRDKETRDSSFVLGMCVIAVAMMLVLLAVTRM